MYQNPDHVRTLHHLPTLTLAIVDEEFNSVEWDESKVIVSIEHKNVTFEGTEGNTLTTEHYAHQCTLKDFKTEYGKEFFNNKDKEGGHGHNRWKFIYCLDDID